MPFAPFATNGSARLAYDVRGAGPAVFLLHAGVTDLRSWGPLIEHLGPGYRTVAYDRRGYGNTTFEPEPHDPVADALAVLDAASVDRAVVVGSSIGGRIAIDLALARPERVAGLVLIGAGVSGAPAPDMTTFSDAVRALDATYEAAEEEGDLDELNRVEAQAWLDGWSAPEGRVRGPARELFLAMNGLSLPKRGTVGPEAPAPPAWDRVEEIAVPTLVLVGQLDDTEIAASQHLGAAIPAARLEFLADTGHLPHLEGHPRCLAAIAEFVANTTAHTAP